MKHRHPVGRWILPALLVLLIIGGVFLYQKISPIAQSFDASCYDTETSGKPTQQDITRPALWVKSAEAAGTEEAEAAKLPLVTGDYVYLGLPDEQAGFDGLFRVLDSDSMNTGEEGCFLLLEHLIGENGRGFIFTDTEDPEGNLYADSDVKKWLASFAERCFSAAELAALEPAYLSDAAYDAHSSLGEMQVTVAFDPAEEILDGDRLFLLSAEEASSASYGFSDNESRMALYNGEFTGWWLRSPHDPSFPLDVGVVFATGQLLDYPVNAEPPFPATLVFALRPACNLSTENILMISEVGVKEKLIEAGTKENAAGTVTAQNAESGILPSHQLAEIPETDGHSFTLTLHDESRDGFKAYLAGSNYADTNETSENVAFDNGCITLRYEGAIVGEKEYITVIAVSESTETEDATTRWAAAFQPTQAEGNIEIDLSDLIAGTEGVNGTVTLYVFSEQINEGTLSDYASLPSALICR